MQRHDIRRRANSPTRWCSSGIAASCTRHYRLVLIMSCPVSRPDAANHDGQARGGAPSSSRLPQPPASAPVSTSSATAQLPIGGQVNKKQRPDGVGDAGAGQYIRLDAAPRCSTGCCFGSFEKGGVQKLELGCSAWEGEWVGEWVSGCVGAQDGGRRRMPAPCVGAPLAAAGVHGCPFEDIWCLG